MKSIFNYLFVLFVLVPAGCSKDILVESPPNFIASETLYTNFLGFDAGINGLYALVRQRDQGLAGGSSLTSDLFMLETDNLTTNHSVSGFNSMSTSWGLGNIPTAAFYSNTFIWLYQIINAANTIIDFAEKEQTNWSGGPGSEEENKQFILANARAVRAWAYRHLTFLWGDVPLNLNVSKGSNIVTDWKRTSVTEVRDMMIADWRFAFQHIPVEPLPGRISKGAVGHYLTETYLVANRLDSALYFANQVINQGEYRLITERYGVDKDKPGVPFMDMFKEGNTNRAEGNTEALWVFQFEKQVVGGGENSIVKRHHLSRYNAIRINGVNPFQFTIERGGRGLGRNSMTKFAIDLYEADDDRGSEYALRKFFILRSSEENAPAPADVLPSGYAYGDTIYLNWDEDISSTKRGLANWPFSRKVEYVDPVNISGDEDFKDQIHLRLADTYLLKAEILFLQDKLEEAAETINVLRRRANARTISNSELSIDFILDERSRELILEEDRRYTLLRTKKWVERTKLYNHNGGQFVTNRDTLFPIPQVVIDANLTSKMEQNAGY